MWTGVGISHDELLTRGITMLWGVVDEIQGIDRGRSGCFGGRVKIWSCCFWGDIVEHNWYDIWFLSGWSSKSGIFLSDGLKVQCSATYFSLKVKISK